MGLKAHERDVLDSIEDQITGSDPRLASMLAVFSRLNAGEPLPAREQIRAGPPRVAVRWPFAWPLVWIIASVGLIVLALALGHGGGSGPCGTHARACAGQTAAHMGW